MGRQTWASVLAVLAALLSGCQGEQAGGQTGDEGVKPVVPPPFSVARNDPCTDVVGERLDGLDSLGPGGYSPADVLAYAAGSFSLPIAWHTRPSDNDWPDIPDLVITPDGAERLTVTIAYTDGDLRTLDSDASFGCHWLEIGVEVEIRSEDGALHETVPGSLVAHSRATARLELRSSTDAIQVPAPRSTVDRDFVVHPFKGDLAVTTDSDGGEVLAFTKINLLLSPFGANGELEAWLHGGGSLWKWVGTIATFGESCPDGYGFVIEDDQPSEGDGMGLTAREVLAIAAGLQAAAHNADGSDAGLSLGFSGADGDVCSVPGQSLTQVASMAIASDFGAGRIRGSLPVELRASLLGSGEVHGLHVGLPDSSLFDELSREQLEADYGITGLDLSGHDSFSLDLRLYYRHADDGVPLDGELTLYGHPAPEDRDANQPRASADPLARLTFGPVQ